MKLEVITEITQDKFVSNYIAKNQQCVIRHDDFGKEQWTPESLRSSVGDLSTHIYDTLFDLQNIDTLAGYLDDFFGRDDSNEKAVSYVRWYNQLKDIDFYWGDEAFDRLKNAWTLPSCVPQKNFLLPRCQGEKSINPVVLKYFNSIAGYEVHSGQTAFDKFTN
jgi:hypothetical protein